MDEYEPQVKKGGFTTEQKIAFGKLALTYIWRLAIVVVYILNVVFQIGGYFGWFCDSTVSGVNSTHETPLTPAGYASAIWGLIFAAQGLFVMYVLLPWSTNWTLFVVAPPLVLGWIMELTWVGLYTCGHWTSQAWVLVVAGVALFAAYALAAIHLHSSLSGLVKRWQHGGGSDHTFAQRLQYFLGLVADWILVFLPTAVNAAWLLVLAMHAVLVSSGDGEDADSRGTGILAITACTLAGLAFSALIFDPVYPATLAWAMLAIAIRQDDGYIRAFSIISLWVLIGCVIFAIILRALWVAWKLGLLTRLVQKIRARNQSRVAYDNYE